MSLLLILADLCLYRQRSDLASFQQSHDFQILNQGIQRLIASLSEGPKNFEELKIVIRRESEDTREYINKAIKQQQNQYDDKEYRTRLLESLWFDEIYSREENIADAHRKTFEWIFDASDHAMGPWDNFIQWLENGQGTYWINGKAGSGKSTLMSFLCQDDRTMESLRRWSGNVSKSVLMPKFYFWSGGTQMQKSIEGLLRSLIWQVLRYLPDLDITSSAFESRDMIPAWTARRLQTTLQSILQRSSGSHLFCLFIDGLDEYEGDQGNLIQFILQLVKSSDVKVCLSSRPYQVFDRAFGQFARLQLHELTHSDIQKVVVDRFQDIPQVQSIDVQRSDWFDDVTHNILARADGVFLWVTLAVNDQIRGLENGDSLEQLRERLESLPDEVEGVYARMLGQIEKIYRKEASIFFQMASQTKCLSVLEFVLGSQDLLEDMLSLSNPVPERELIAESRSVRQRIGIICAGLLEINESHELESRECSDSKSDLPPLESENASLQPDTTSLSEDASSKAEDMSLRPESKALKSDNESDDSSWWSGPANFDSRNLVPDEATDHEIFDHDRKVAVGFIHRTARDFMRDPAQGGSFLRANTPSGFQAQATYVKVLLAKARLFRSPHRYVDDIMYSVSSAEDKTGVAQTRLCDLIDDVMSRMDRTDRPWPTNSHWSIRWGDKSWRSIHKDLRSLDSKANSPSSSNDSFHSVSSQPDTSDDLRMTLIRKPDFLAFAVYHSLHRYVQEVIHDRKEPLDADTVSYLLYCAVSSLVWEWQWGIIGRADGHDLINEFLGQGGSPNLKGSRRTVWSMFLVGVHLIMSHENESRRADAQTIMIFIEKGADLHSIFAIPSKIIHSSVMEYSLDLDLSALAIIELHLNNEPGYSHVRDLCASKGAPYYSRCTQIKQRRRWISNWERRLKLSDRESTAILELYKTLFAPDSSVAKAEEMATYFNKLFKDRVEDVSDIDPL